MWKMDLLWAELFNEVLWWSMCLEFLKLLFAALQYQFFFWILFLDIQRKLKWEDRKILKIKYNRDGTTVVYHNNLINKKVKTFPDFKNDSKCLSYLFIVVTFETTPIWTKWSHLPPQHPWHSNWPFTALLWNKWRHQNPIDL